MGLKTVQHMFRIRKDMRDGFRHRRCKVTDEGYLEARCTEIVGENIKKDEDLFRPSSWSFDTPGEIRTPDTWYRKPVLYPLSYGCMCVTRIYYTFVLLKKQSCSLSFFKRERSGFVTID